MNYPGKAKKQFKKELISHANRGMELEHIINDANAYYLDKNIAIIYKKPTPINIVKIDYDKKRITDAFFKEASTLDYNGVYKGLYIEFDAKECNNKTSFTLRNIHDHQIKHMERILEHHGICFLIIGMNCRYFLFDGNTLIDFINNNDRKSIPYSFIVENSFEIKYNYLKGLDYIEALDRLLEVKYEKR